MLKIKNAVKKYRSIPVATGVASVAMAFPAFAEGGTPATGLDSLLATFSVVTAWLWKECGLLDFKPAYPFGRHVSVLRWRRGCVLHAHLPSGMIQKGTPVPFPH